MAPEAPVLCVDVMDTLVVDPFHEELPGFFGLDLEGYLAAKEPGTWEAFETARLSEERFAATMFRDRRPVDVDALRAFLARTYRWVDGMQELLHELSSDGIEIHAMSNYPVWYHLIEEELGLSRYLQWTFVSWDQGLRKPDRRAYARLQSAVGHPPSRLVLVDDQERNVEGALGAGWRGIRFTDVSSLRVELDRLV